MSPIRARKTFRIGPPRCCVRFNFTQSGFTRATDRLVALIDSGACPEEITLASRAEFAELVEEIGGIRR